MYNQKPRILKFPLSERLFHGINMITWMALAFTGIVVYFEMVDQEQAKFMMDLHIYIAIAFTANFAGFVFLNTDRFMLMMRNLMIWDKDTLDWFKNFGGYPKRIFGINFGPEKVAPQGRFNAGQKGTYLYFIFMIFALIVTGWALYALAPLLGKTVMEWMFYVHVWGGIFTTALAICGHFPMALLNMGDFVAIFGNGEVLYEDAKHHAPKWVRDDLVKLEEQTTK